MIYEDIGVHRVFLGDCREILPLVEPFDAIVTDPPYGINTHRGDKGFGRGHARRRHGVQSRVFGDDRPFSPEHLLHYTIPLVCWGANFYSHLLPGGSWLIWDKRPGVPTRGWRYSEAELAYCSVGNTVHIFDYTWFGLVRAGEQGEHFHPTQKPVALMRWCIERLRLLPSATIIDPYMGAGTTGVACLQLGCRFLGIEIDQEHFDCAVRRLQDAVRQPSLFSCSPRAAEQLSLRL